MKETTYSKYADFVQLLAKYDMLASPAEVHGLIAGMLAGGLPSGEQSWQVHLNDLFNDGYALPVAFQRDIERLVKQTEVLFCSDEFAFHPLLPSDNEPLDERTEAMAQWVQNFLVGFALVCHELAKAPDDIQELITDFNQIAQLSLEIDSEDESNEQAFFEIFEYVRMGAMACFNHYALRPSSPKSATLH